MIGDSAKGAADTAKPGSGYRHLVLWMLVLVYMVNFVDRQIVAMLGQYIIADLHLTKTEFGLLGGTAFALFYTVCGIPVAWLADRGSRVRILTAACAIWSIFTALCGATTNFIQIALCRMGTGVGEAGGSPPSYSLISDYFPPRERGRALAIYSLGYPLGAMVGAFAAGRIAELWGWRMAFYLVGFPGVVLALVIPWVIREPRRGILDVAVDGKDHEPAPPLGAAIAHYFGNRTLLLTAVSSAFSAFVNYAGLIWHPQFLILVKGMSSKDVANIYSVVLGVTGAIGILAGGLLVDKLGHADRRWYAWIPAIACAASIPFWIGMIWAPSWQLAIVFMAGPLLLINMYLAPALALVQNAVAPGMRTVAGAILLFVLNLVGLGVGPVYVGWIADAMEPIHGHNALAFGYAAVVPVLVITVGAHILTSLSIARDKHLAATVHLLG